MRAFFGVLYAAVCTVMVVGFFVGLAWFLGSDW